MVVVVVVVSGSGSGSGSVWRACIRGEVIRLIHHRYASPVLHVYTPAMPHALASCTLTSWEGEKVGR
jgi:hypothetical protein